MNDLQAFPVPGVLYRFERNSIRFVLPLADVVTDVTEQLLGCGVDFQFTSCGCKVRVECGDPLQKNNL